MNSQVAAGNRRVIHRTMEEMEAMGAPLASLFGEAEPRSLDGAASYVLNPDA